MRNEHNCRSMQTSFRRLEQSGRAKGFHLDELDELLAPLRDRLENSSYGLNEPSARNSAERSPDGYRCDDYSLS